MGKHVRVKNGKHTLWTVFRSTRYVYIYISLAQILSFFAGILPLASWAELRCVLALSLHQRGCSHR
jgi:uncharacterized membrane protein YhdT